MGMSVEVVNYRDLQRKLRTADPAVQKEFNKKLRTLTKEIVAEAKTAGSWSSKIPPAIGTSVTARGAGVKVSKKNGPFPVLNELGSRGNRGQIRHPLFGNHDYWYVQPTRPVVTPIVKAARLRLKIAAEAAARDALREAGL